MHQEGENEACGFPCHSRFNRLRPVLADVHVASTIHSLRLCHAAIVPWLALACLSVCVRFASLKNALYHRQNHAQVHEQVDVTPVPLREEVDTSEDEL